MITGVLYAIFQNENNTSHLTELTQITFFFGGGGRGGSLFLMIKFVFINLIS